MLNLILNNCVSLFSLQPLLGAIGLFCVFLSVMSSYGICSMLGLIFSPMHNMIPFLLMGKSENCAKTMISFFLLHKTILVLHMWLEGCPNPNKMEQSWECTFLKLFKYTYEDKMSIKKRFHHWTSELPAGMHGQSCLDGPDRPCILTSSFVILILYSHG